MPGCQKWSTQEPRPTCGVCKENIGFSGLEVFILSKQVSPWQCSIWYCPLFLCTTFWAMNLLIGKSNFCNAFSPGKDVYSANMIITCSIQFNGFEKFFLINFHFNRIYKKSEKWTVRFKAQRVQVIYRMHWHQMRWGSPHKDIDTPWPKPKQHRCQYEWDNVDMWTPHSMIYNIARNKDTCNLTMYRCFGISLDEQWPCTCFVL